MKNKKYKFTKPLNNRDKRVSFNHLTSFYIYIYIFSYYR